MAKKYISGMVDPEVKEFIEKEAVADKRSVSFMLNELLSLGVHTYEKKHARKAHHAAA
jgi:hypothetical protein